MYQLSASITWGRVKSYPSSKNSRLFYEKEKLFTTAEELFSWWEENVYMYEGEGKGLH